MAVLRAAPGSSLIDVLDRQLDKGLVIDPYLRSSLPGIHLADGEARLVVAAVETWPNRAPGAGPEAGEEDPTTRD